MLQSLNIKNFGLIEEINLDFHEHLNVLTGQTGAGKSILLEGVRVALGGRFTAAQIRDLQKPSIVEAIFDLAGTEVQKNPDIQEFLLEEDAQLIILRSFDNKGRSKIKINGMSVNVTTLKKIGSLLLDFNGAHDHQTLLQEEAHLTMLDRLIDFKGVDDLYKEAYGVYADLKHQEEELENLKQTRERELDLLSHQVQELEQVPLDQKHYEKASQEQSKMNNAEKLHQYAHELMQLLDEQSGSCLDQVRKLFSPMRQLNDTDDQSTTFMELLTQFQDVGDELSSELRNYVEGLSFDPQEAMGIAHQADIYHDILRKYGTNLQEVNQFYETIKEKHHLLHHFDSNQADINKKLKAQEKIILEHALDMRQKRTKVAAALKKTIEKELSELGISHVKFEARFENKDFTTQGKDRVVFYISPNAGVDLKPLSEIVSSGEAARVMLALKKALIKVDPVPVLIFDEIDAQIGGRLGKITGEKLKSISRVRQVLLITHLPQIASFANHHFKVLKSVHHKQTQTNCVLLDDNARIDELAQMMSGSRESEISLRHAEDMLLQASA